MTFDSIMRIACYLGKGDVESSILSGSTTYPAIVNWYEARKRILLQFRDVLQRSSQCEETTK